MHLFSWQIKNREIYITSDLAEKADWKVRENGPGSVKLAWERTAGRLYSIQYGTGFIECASETPDNKYGGISKQGIEKTDKEY